MCRRTMTVVLGSVLLLGGITVAVVELERPPDVDVVEGSLPFAASAAELPHEIVVASHDGRPGLQFRSVAPSASFPETGATTGPARSEATVRLGGDGVLLVVSLGRVDEVGGAEAESLRFAVEPALGERVGPVTRASSALGESWTVVSELGTSRLTEIRVERDGYLYAIGILRPTDRPEADGVAAQMLATWEWLRPSS